ncbi:MAG: ABC transporter ATP-binding protein [Kiloniellales bacterium]|nr:ABC transporter ATP-binding protein [Kiloniellales bacterium]
MNEHQQAPAGTDTALRLDKIVKSFAEVRAVDRVSLDIRRGEFLTLLGPSGSGKSTLLMLVAGFLEPDAGEIYLDGAAVSRVPAHHRRIGVVFQNYALFPHLTVFENVAFALRNLRWPAQQIAARVAEMLALVRLEGMAERLPSELSGGQQQRVALARAVAFQPALLLLDEPLGALDRKLREHMHIELRHIHQVLGTTMVYVTHDQEEAMVMSDRIAIMNHGRIVGLGTPKALYEDPGDPFVADFLGEATILEGRVDAEGRGLIDATGVQVELREPTARGSRFSLAIRPEKVQLGAAPAGWNSLPGTVEEVLYLGDATKYYVRVSAEHQVIAKLTNQRPSVQFQQGAAVQVTWHPEDGRLLEVAGSESVENEADTTDTPPSPNLSPQWGERDE